MDFTHLLRNTWIILVFFSVLLQAQIRIAVLKLKPINIDENQSFAVEEILRTQLIGSPDYEVIERDQIDRLIEEQRLKYSGFVDTKTAAELGRILGASRVIIGTVIGGSGGMIVNLRLVDANTAQSQLGISENIAGEGDLLRKVSILSDKIKSRIRSPAILASSCIDQFQYGPEKAFDGDLRSTWMAGHGTYQGWLEISFPTDRTLSTIELVNRDPTVARGAPKEFYFECYKAGQWVPVFHVPSNRRGHVKYQFSPVNAKRWRIRVLSVINPRESLQVAEVILE